MFPPASAVGVRIGVALTAVVLLAGGCRRQPPAETEDEQSIAVPVAAEPVEIGSLRAVVRATGVVVPADGAEFLAVAPEPARVLEITKAVTDTVASGEVLVQLELAGAAQDLARQRADLARAEAQLESARVAQSRVRDFVVRGLVPRLDLDAAERELSEAQSAVDRANSSFKAAEAAAGRAIVRAPFAGVVAARLHDAGDLVQPAAVDPILRIVDPRRVEVTASIAGADAPRVLPGASARMVDPRDGSSILLSVANRSAGPAAAGATVLVRLVPAQPLTVAVDTPVAVEIDAEERAHIVFVSPATIIEDRGEMVVMVAAGDRAERRVVTTGITTDAGVEITSGLKPGDLVITQGHIGLEHGAVVSTAIRGR